MKRSQLGINSISLNFSDFTTSLKAVKAAGFTKIEFMLGHVKDYMKLGHSAKDVRALLDQVGLECIGGFQTHLEVFGPDRAANHKLIVENAELLSILGGKNLVVGTDGPSTPVADVLGDIAKTVGEVAGKMKLHGVNLLLEFNWSPVMKSMRTAAEIARRSGASNAGVLFDPAHYHCTPTKFDQLNPENIAFVKHVHVDDMRDKPGELSNCNDDRALPGEGILDLAALFGQLEKHGYAGDFSIEMFNQELWNMPPGEAAARMYRSLRTLCKD